MQVLHLLEIGSHVNAPQFTHKTGIVDIALNQAGSMNNRVVAFIDKNKDLHVMVVNVKNGSSGARKIEKLGESVIDIYKYLKTKFIATFVLILILIKSSEMKLTIYE